MRLKLYEEKDRNYCVYSGGCHIGRDRSSIYFSQGEKGYDHNMYEF